MEVLGRGLQLSASRNQGPQQHPTGDQAAEKDDEDESEDSEDEKNEDEREVLKQMKFPGLQGGDSLTSIAVASCSSLQKRMAKLALLESKFKDLQNPLDLHKQTPYGNLSNRVCVCASYREGLLANLYILSGSNEGWERRSRQ